MRISRFLLAGVLLLIPCLASAQPADTLLAAATTALAEQRTEDGIALLQRTTAQHPDEAEAYYLLARAYADLPDYGKAKSIIKKAIDLDEDNPRYLTLRLRLLREAPLDFIPNYQELRRKRLAERILEIDPNNALAYIELGDWEADTYFQYRHAVYVDNNIRPSEDIYDPFEHYDEPDAEERVLGPAMLDKSAPARPAFEDAVERFEQALRANPSERPVYAPLLRLYVAAEDYAEATRVASTMQQHFPDDAEAHLYAGLTHAFGGDFDAANAAFERALPLLPEEQRRFFDDLDVLLRQNDEERAFTQHPERFWTMKDPRLLTDYSERRLEHYARLVYADLFYGTDDRRGWDTEIGQVLIRYGPPGHVEDQTVGEVSDHANLRRWYYGDFRFHFEKKFRGESYHFTDYTRTELHHIYREHPQGSQYTPAAPRERLPFLASAFKGDDGQPRLYVPMAVPVPGPPQDGSLTMPLRTGIFLLHPQSGLVTAQRDAVTELAAPQIRTQADSTHWITVPRTTAPPGDYALSVEFESTSPRAVGYERGLVTLPDFTGDALQLSDLVLAFHVEERIDGDLPSDDALLVRGRHVIQALPWNRIATGQPLYLYVETYNQTPGSDYEVEAALVPEEVRRGLLARLFGRDDPEGVSVRFTTTATAADEGQYVILDTNDLADGTYTVRLQVRDTGTGDAVTSTRTIRLD